MNAPHMTYSYVLNNPLKYTDPSGYTQQNWGHNPPWNNMVNRLANEQAAWQSQFGWHHSFFAYDAFGGSQFIGGGGGGGGLQLSDFGLSDISSGQLTTLNSMLEGTGIVLGVKNGEVGFWRTYGRVVQVSAKDAQWSSCYYITEHYPVFVPFGSGETQSKKNTREPLFSFVGFNRGIPEFETNFTDKDWGAITPGPFIIYSKRGSKDPYYNTHEPGHVIQFLILGPFLYYSLVGIPSLFTAYYYPNHHSDMTWEKSANQLWYWVTGEHDPSNPLYHGP